MPSLPQNRLTLELFVFKFPTLLLTLVLTLLSSNLEYKDSMISQMTWLNLALLLAITVADIVLSNMQNTRAVMSQIILSIAFSTSNELSKV